MLTALERGLTMQDIKEMTIGQVVDFCIEYQNRQYEIEKEEKRRETKGRKATQADWDSFLG